MRANEEAQPFSKVLAQELDDIDSRRIARQPRCERISNNQCSEKRADHAALFGICLSGGGIRSATFSLGILQGLAKLGILQQADYLSTVSGGGYIGSWLQGILIRHRNFEALTSEDRDQQAPLQFLRKYSNYLAPRPGMSLDSAAIPSIWIRNTILNQVILVAASFFVILLLCVPGRLVFEARCWTPSLAFTLAFLLTVLNLFFVTRNLRDVVHGEFKRPGYVNRSDPSKKVAVGVVVSLLAAACSLVCGTLNASGLESSWMFGLVLLLLHSFLLVGGGFWECFCANHPVKSFWKSWAGPLMAFILISSTNLDWWLLSRAAAWIHSWSIPSLQGDYAAVAWGPPLVLFAVFTGVSLQVGLMGKDYPDAAREWLARVGAWVTLSALAWAAIFTVAVFIPYWLGLLWQEYHYSIETSALAWIGTTAAGIFAGKSPTTGKTSKLSVPTLDWVARYAPLVALPGFFIAIAVAVHAVLGALYPGQAGATLLNSLSTNYWNALLKLDPFVFTLLLLAAACVFLALSLRVNINEFSMHHFYKNRLVRCYLGASAPSSRDPNHFTGFDPKDDIPLSQLVSTRDACLVGPYPILNATLNVTQGSELATQERKAKSWIFTPRFSGFTTGKSDANTNAGHLWPDGYVRTDKVLGGNLHIGTAMAISGAALNPAQGYHTSSQVAFLMTLFNVRLGWWLGNPRNARTFSRSGPRIALAPLIQELFGAVDERAAYLNLADGGNFENLGLYELVRRRCRYIIAVDAEEDPTFEFSALSGAVRKCRTDFAAEIDINPRQLRPVEGLSRAHCAVGTITYRGGVKGTILYFKTTMTGDEPADIEGYRQRNPAFPQQSTADQFFSESQFESYRRLGLHCVESAIDPVKLPLDKTFERLSVRWQTPPGTPESASTQHAGAYSKLLDQWAKTAGLETHDAEFVPDVPPGFESGPARAQLFFILDLLQFMDNVFVDCHFGQSENRDHPSNEGWMNIFRHWARQQPVQKVWQGQRENFRGAFRYFMDDLISESRNGQHRTICR